MSGSDGENSEEEYEVEAIKDFRDEDSDGNDVKEYLVKWKGFDSDDNTWEPKDNLQDPLVKEKIRKYKKYKHLESNSTSTDYSRRENRHIDEEEDRRKRKESRKRKIEELNQRKIIDKKIKNRKNLKKENDQSRSSKGNNAYGKIQKNLNPSLSSIPSYRAKEKKKKPFQLGRPPPKQSNSRSENAVINDIYNKNKKSLTSLGPAAVPRNKIAKKEKLNSYDALKDTFYAQQNNAANSAQASTDVLDEF
jgi:phenylalanyl-tRNA synthetase alpha subunit